MDVNFGRLDNTINTAKIQQKYRITSVEMKFMRITPKYTWQDYNTD